MVPDISTFIATCTVCAQSKTLRQAAAGLLQPLSVPHHPWSHISLDFVTGLPPSDSNTTILTEWIGFPKPPISFPFSSYPQPRKRSSSWYHGSMHFRSTWSLIVVLSSRPNSGRCSAPSLGHRPACPPGFIPNLTASRSEPIRTWRLLFVALSLPTPTTWSQQLVWVEYTRNTLPCSATSLVPV